MGREAQAQPSCFLGSPGKCSLSTHGAQGIPAPPPTAQQEQRTRESPTGPRWPPAGAGGKPWKAPVQGASAEGPSSSRLAPRGRAGAAQSAGSPVGGAGRRRAVPVAPPSVPGRTPGPGPGQVRGPGACSTAPARLAPGPAPALPARPAPVQPAGRPCDPGPGSRRWALTPCHPTRAPAPIRCSRPAGRGLLGPAPSSPGPWLPGLARSLRGRPRVRPPKVQRRPRPGPALHSPAQARRVVSSPGLAPCPARSMLPHCQA